MARTTISHISMAKSSQGTWIEGGDYGLTRTEEEAATTPPPRLRPNHCHRAAGEAEVLSVYYYGQNIVVELAEMDEGGQNFRWQQQHLLCKTNWIRSSNAEALLLYLDASITTVTDSYIRERNGILKDRLVFNILYSELQLT
jgi:hypothetical protein